MSVFQGTSLLSLGGSHQGSVSCPVPGFTQSCKSQEKLKTMLMQNFGWTTKSIMVFLRKGYEIRHCNTCMLRSEGGLQNSCGQCASVLLQVIIT